MEIKISQAAIQWYENELPLDEGEGVRFFGKTYGKTNVHDGFSIGMQIDQVDDYQELIAHEVINERHYFAAKEDEWFFSGYNLEIDLDENTNEPFYLFTQGE